MGMKPYLSPGERAENRRAARRRWYAANADIAHAKQKAWREKNKEHHRARNKAWKQANPEKVKQMHRSWRSDPVKRMRTLVLGRVWEAKRKGTPYDLDALMELVAAPPMACALCGVTLDYANIARQNTGAPSIDKVAPSRGYVRGNIAVLCRGDNSIKGGASAIKHRAIAEFIERFGAAGG